jgi:ssDNA-binding Zn-finger/Zn-ribbon topoisomerase 1
MKSRPVLVLFPGASLMNIQLDGDILVIACPGCHETLRVRQSRAGHVNFVHEDGCPIHERIQVLLAAPAPGGRQ